MHATIELLEAAVSVESDKWLHDAAVEGLREKSSMYGHSAPAK